MVCYQVSPHHPGVRLQHFDPRLHKARMWILTLVMVHQYLKIKRQGEGMEAVYRPGLLLPTLIVTVHLLQPDQDQRHQASNIARHFPLSLVTYDQGKASDLLMLPPLQVKYHPSISLHWDYHLLDRLLLCHPRGHPKTLATLVGHP